MWFCGVFLMAILVSSDFYRYCWVKYIGYELLIYLAVFWIWVPGLLAWWVHIVLKKERCFLYHQHVCLMNWFFLDVENNVPWEMAVMYPAIGYTQVTINQALRIWPTLQMVENLVICCNSHRCSASFIPSEAGPNNIKKM